MSGHQIWAFDFTGRVFRLMGKEIKVEEQLTEVLDERMGQRQVLTLARYVETDEPIMLKIRYELNPADFEIEDVDENQDITEEHFCHEIDTLQGVEHIGHGPKYIDHVTLNAGKTMPYPPGLVDFLITTRVPGENVDDIHEDLSDDQLRSIKKQLAFILESMRQYGKTLYQQHPSFLRYDKEADKLYLVDFTFYSFTDPNSPHSLPITEDDMYVCAFNLWNRPSLQDPPPSPPKKETPKSPVKKGGPSGLGGSGRGGKFKENQRPPWR